MNVQQIDLSRFTKGATIGVQFDAPDHVKPFLIYATGIAGKPVYYQRLNDRGKISINFPDVPEDGQMLLWWSGDLKIKQTWTGPLKIYKIPYKHNEAIKQVRPYKFEEIREVMLPYIPEMQEGPNGEKIYVESTQPARFFPATGEAQFSQKVMNDMPIPVQIYVNKHEKGHYYYGRPIPSATMMQKLTWGEQQRYLQQLKEDEMEADRFALYWMINQGYNFTGTLYALTNHLPPNYMSKERILNLYNEISRINKHLV